MKIKEGKLSLGKNDLRVGNFVLSKEKMHYKMQDINGYWSNRVAFMHPMYMLLEECVKADNKEYIEMVVKILYAISTTPPDVKMLGDMYNAYNALIERMKEKGLVSEQQDAENIEAVKRSIEAKEQLTQILNDQPDTDTQGQPL